MAKFIFIEKLKETLDRKRAWPSYANLREFSKERGGGFKNNKYKLIRNGHATEDYQFLIDILLCIYHHSPMLCREEFDASFGERSETELLEHYVQTVDENYQPANQVDADLIGGGPLAAAGEVIQLKSSSIEKLRLKHSDIGNASRLWAEAVSFSLLGEYTTNADAEATALEEFSYASIAQFEDYLGRLIDANPNSVLFHQAENGSGFLLIAFPVDDQTYDRLFRGELDECEIAAKGIASKSKNFCMWGVFEYYRELSAAQRLSMHTKMMNCSLWQIASSTEDLLSNGMRIIAYSPLPGRNPATRKIERWLKRWKFKRTGLVMKRTGFPLWQLKLKRAPIHHPMAIVIWCLILLYQTIVRRSGNKAISEWMEEE